MKYIIVDDEHELYKQMYSDILLKKSKKFDVEEIKRITIPTILKPFYKLHFSDKINSHFFIPLKSIWNRFYQLHQYDYKDSERYCIIFLNGTLRTHYSKKYFEKLKAKHTNIKLVMILYDSKTNPSSKRAYELIDVFDTIFSFDEADCKKYGFEYIYSTFSIPDFVKTNSKYYSSAFFIGYGQGRLNILKKTFQKITQKLDKCVFIIAGVNTKEQERIKGVKYNKTLSYKEELMYAYNTECVVEIVREGQTGVTLRTCEAVAFNKKLLTNNKNLKNMPFYDERYMYIFDDVDDIDMNFLLNRDSVLYEKNDYFSPINILKRLDEIYSKD